VEVLDCEAVMSLADRYVFFNQHLNLPRFTSEDEVSTARPLGSVLQSLSFANPSAVHHHHSTSHHQTSINHFFCCSFIPFMSG